MPNVMEPIYAKARAVKRRIVLPEADDVRTVSAAAKIVERGLADVVLVSDQTKIAAACKQSGADVSACTIVDPVKSALRAEYAKAFYELRKAKGVSEEQAFQMMADPLYFGCMMVYSGEADGQVSGATHSTADTVRPALQILKTAPGCKLVSSLFVMIVPDCQYGENGVFIYADCGLVINPDPDQLAEIAIQSAKSMRSLLGFEPRVAMLCFSTKGSASNPIADKVIEATRIAKQLAPDLLIDGELQADAALVDWIADRKAPDSPVAGRANVLVFPDINAGNICYKLTQRLAKAEAYGPILQGLRKPVNDLSRGCGVEDIVNVAAITAAQAIEL